MILVDTSAWVDFFRDQRLASLVDDALDAGLVALCGPIVTELRRGLPVRQRDAVLELLAGCTMLEEPDGLWQEAGDLGFTLSRRGLSVKTFDLLIAVHALAHDVPLLTADRDFQLMIKAGVPLRLARR